MHPRRPAMGKDKSGRTKKKAAKIRNLPVRSVKGGDAAAVKGGFTKKTDKATP